MNTFKRFTTIAVAIASIAAAALAQDNSSSSSSIVRRRANDRNAKDPGSAQVTQRMQSFYDADGRNLSDADLQWMRVIYRQLDLDKDQNAPLYFPEEPIDGQENLFRIIMRLLAENRLNAYEYLDGREIFTDQYKVKVRDVLDRFHIIYTEGKGSTEKNPRFVIEEADVPANEVLSYYVIEEWKFDTRNNRMRTDVVAICPVLHRSGDFGGEAVKYPMFWVKFSDIRPWLAQQHIFTSDDNNLPTCTYDDFFNLTMYDGEIYKTRNLKNKSMMQLYPDPEDRQRAQDSIQNRLDSFEKKLWVKNREEIIAAQEKASKKNDAVAPGDSIAIVIDTENALDNDAADKPKARQTKRGKKEAKESKAKESKVKQAKPKAAKSSSGASKSVRRRKK